MSFNQGILGQTDVSTIAQSQPVETPITETLQTKYAGLRTACIERFGADFCNSVMPESVFYALRKEDSGLPFWAWMLIGFIAAKIVRF